MYYYYYTKCTELETSKDSGDLVNMLDDRSDV